MCNCFVTNWLEAKGGKGTHGL